MKKILALFLALCMISALCVVSASADDEPSVLKVAAFEGGYGVDYWEKICSAFEEAYGCKVELTASPTIDEIVRPQMIAGDYPDVLFLNGASMALYSEMVKEHAFEPLDDVFASKAYDHDCTVGELIAPGLLQTAFFSPYGDGKCYSAPMSSNAQAMVYNKTLFEQNGWEVPTTWDEFFALGDAAKEKGYSLITYPGAYPDYNEVILLGALASALGPDAVTRANNYDASLIETDEAKTVFETLAKIAAGGYLMPGTTGLNHTQAQSEFMLDKALFIPNGDWLPGEMADAPRTEGFEWAACPVFAMKEGGDRYYRLICDGFNIPTSAQNKELAKEFVRFFYSDQAQIFQNESGITPCTVNFAEVIGELSPDKVTFLKIRDEGIAFSSTFTAVDTKLSYADAIYGNLTSVMNGELDAEGWRAAIIDTFTRISAGE